MFISVAGNPGNVASFSQPQVLRASRSIPAIYRQSATACFGFMRTARQAQGRRLLSIGICCSTLLTLLLASTPRRIALTEIVIAAEIGVYVDTDTHVHWLGGEPDVVDLDHWPTRGCLRTVNGSLN